jgi:hypothetical protein
MKLRSTPVRCFWILGLLAPLAARAATVAVDFAPTPGADAWLSAAMEGTVGRELSRFHRVELEEKVGADACPDRKPQCLVDRYRAAGVDLLVLGAVSSEGLEYEVYATWTRAVAFRGSLRLHRGLTSAVLQQRLSGLVRPIVQGGGWADQVPAAAPKSEAESAGVAPGLPEVVARSPALPLGLAALAGALWGAFALLTAGWLFPRLYGIGRVRHDALWSLLKSWFALVSLRATLLAVYAGVFAGTLVASRRLGLDLRLSVGVLLPAVGLLTHLAFLLVVDGLAAYLDRAAVVGAASEQNPWHRTIKRYFLGYVRRNGIDLDRALIDRTLFLPGTGDATCYGGGLSRPRVIVDVAARDLALGELPDEDEAPERTVNPEDLPWGLLMPVSPDKERSPRKAARAAAERRRRVLAPAPRGAAPRLVGQNATLLGWVLPATAKSSVPLISDSREDFDVVRSLLTEHYAAFEKNLDEDEYDDTDPTQKDYLFGALLLQMGAIRRQEARLSTLVLALEVAAARAPKWIRWVPAVLAGLRARFFSRPAATVADAYVALHSGLDALVQYFHLRRGGDPALLTARANAPGLLATTQTIVGELEQSTPSKQEEQSLRATPRSRTLRLVELFYAPIAPRGRLRPKVLLALLALALGGLAIVQATSSAMAYHPVFVERMREMQARAAQDQGAADGGQHP